MLINFITYLIIFIHSFTLTDYSLNSYLSIRLVSLKTIQQTPQQQHIQHQTRCSVHFAQRIKDTIVEQMGVGGFWVSRMLWSYIIHASEPVTTQIRAFSSKRYIYIILATTTSIYSGMH